MAEDQSSGLPVTWDQPLTAAPTTAAAAPGPAQINAPPYPGATRIEDGIAYNIKGERLGAVDEQGKAVAAPQGPLGITWDQPPPTPPAGATPQPTDMRRLTASLPGAIQQRPGGPISNVRNPAAGEQDPGVAQGVKDSLYEAAHGLWTLAKAQYQHEMKHNMFTMLKQFDEGNYKAGAMDALKHVFYDKESPIGLAARQMAIDSIKNEYTAAKQRVQGIEQLLTGDKESGKKSIAKSVKSQIAGIPGIGPGIVKVGEDIAGEQPGYGVGEGIGLTAQMAVPEIAEETGLTGAIGRGLEKVAPESINSLLRAGRKENYLYGKNPGQSFIDEQIKVPKTSVTMLGHLENLHGQLEGSISNLMSQLNTILSDPAVAARTQDVVPVVRQTIADAKAFVAKQSGLDAPAYMTALDRLEDSILTRYDPATGRPLGTITGTRLTPQQVSDLKTSIGKNTNWKVFQTDPDFTMKTYVNGVRKRIYGQLADKVEAAAPTEPVKQLNGRLANAIEAQGLLERRIAYEHGTGGYAAMGRKAEALAGVAGLVSPEPVSGTIGKVALADRMLRSVAGRIMTSKLLSKAGRLLQRTGLGAAGPAATVAGQAGEKLPQEPEQPEELDTSDWQTIKLSSGQSFMIHPEDMEEAQKRITAAGLKIVQ